MMGTDLDLGGFSKEVGIMLEPEEWIRSGLVKVGREFQANITVPANVLWQERAWHSEN